MPLRLRPLHQQTLVITGASSGIGLATAQMAARQGAAVVLVARDEPALQEATRAITAAGGRALYVVADVAQRDEVQLAADTAIEHFGGIDTWVNNAGVSIWGRLDDVRDNDHRRLFETNFWGVVNGSLVAAAHLRRRGGAIINLGSMMSDRALPLQGMYSASKHAVKGFTDSLRVELAEDGAPISVTLIKPGAIGTPFTEHARNYTGHEPQLPPPVYAPEEVARAILHAAQRPVRDLFVGSTSLLASVANRIAPGFIDRFGRLMSESQLSDRPAQRHPDSLHAPSADGRVRGHHPGKTLRPSLYTRAVLHPRTTLALVAAGVGAVLALYHRGQAHRGTLRRPV